MTDELISRAEQSLEGVTEGPWVIDDDLDGTASIHCGEIFRGSRSILVSGDGYHYGYADLADAKFIAAARSLVPELLEALKEARDRIAFLERALRNAETFAEAAKVDLDDVVEMELDEDDVERPHS